MIASEDTRNLLALYAVRVGGHITSLALLPYLAKSLGAEGLGLWIYAQSLSAYVGLLSDLGLGLHGERLIARSRGSLDLPALIWTLTLTRIGLGSLIAGGLFLALYLVQLHHISLVGLTLLGTLLGSFFPSSVFIGLEKQRYPAIAGLAHHLGLLFFALAFVRGPQDLFLFAKANALLAGFNLVIGLIWIKRNFGNPTWQTAIFGQLLKVGHSIYFFQIVAGIYTTLGPTLAYWIGGPETAATYGLAEKLMRAIGGFWGPYFALIPPKLAYWQGVDPAQSSRLVRNYFKIGCRFGSILSLMVIISSLLAPCFLDQEYIEATKTLLFLSPIPLLTAISNILGLGVAFSKGKDQLLMGAISMGALTFLVLGASFTWLLGSPGTASALCIAEAMVTLFLWRGVRKL